MLWLSDDWQQNGVYMEQVHGRAMKLPVTIIRGGTSKGVYILEENLPKDKNEWDAILLRLMGSPDKKQIDGLGGLFY